MYVRALAGRKKALRPDHTSTLSTVNNLGILYRDQRQAGRGGADILTGADRERESAGTGLLIDFLNRS
jgi:hypothetical protein